MRYVEKYDEGRLPAAPKIEVKLENPVSRKSLSKYFYIDTGFDGSLLLSSDLWYQLGLDIVEVEDEVYAVHGGFMPIRLRAALVSISILSYRVEKLIVYMHPLLKHPLIGRELLNKFYLYLKGPEKTTILLINEEEK